MKCKASSYDKKTDMRDSLKTITLIADNKDEGQCLSALYKAFYLRDLLSKEDRQFIKRLASPK